MKKANPTRVQAIDQNRGTSLRSKVANEGPSWEAAIEDFLLLVKGTREDREHARKRRRFSAPGRKYVTSDRLCQASQIAGHEDLNIVTRQYRHGDPVHGCVRSLGGRIHPRGGGGRRGGVSGRQSERTDRYDQQAFEGHASRAGGAGSGTSAANGQANGKLDLRRVTIPWFVLGSVAMVGVSSLGIVGPEQASRGSWPRLSPALPRVRQWQSLP